MPNMYCFNESEFVSNVHYLKSTLKTADLSLACVKTFVNLLGAYPLYEESERFQKTVELFNHLNNIQKRVLLTVPLCPVSLFGRRSFDEPFGNAFEIMKAYRRDKEDLKNFLKNELKIVNQKFCKSAATGFFSKIGMPANIGLIAGEFFNVADSKRLLECTGSSFKAIKK